MSMSKAAQHVVSCDPCVVCHVISVFCHVISMLCHVISVLCHVISILCHVIFCFVSCDKGFNIYFYLHIL